MKARITHLKAPWPLGALVGDVVLFESGVVPVWAVGKCEAASDEDEPAHVVTAAPAAPESTDLAELQRVVEEAQAHIDSLKANYEAQLAELQAKLQAAEGETLAAVLARDEATAQLAELQAKLEAAAPQAKKKG